MAAEDFFSRWSRVKQDAQTESVRPVAPLADSTATPVQQLDAGHPEQIGAAPDMEDVVKLDANSDYTRFMAKDVDETVRRSAMKKLFSDPHFNIMDGLDIYIGDYSQPDPMPAGMLESLLHAKALLDPLEHLETTMHSLLESSEAETISQPETHHATAPENLPETKEIVPDTPALPTGSLAENNAEIINVTSVTEGETGQEPT
jgi:hypothetical protein